VITRADRRIGVLAWVLVILPALLLLAYILAYSNNGADWDHVTSAEIFDRAHNGQLTAEFIFRPHNEHRIAAVRLVVLGLGELTRWNTRVEAVAHWALMCATALLLFRAFRRDARLQDSRTRALLYFAPMACLLTSPRSYEAFLSDGFPHYLSILGMIGAFCLLVFAPPTAGALAGAIACGLLSTFSLANGMLVWPIGLLILLCHMRSLNGDPPREATWWRAAVWAVVGVLTIAGYFYGYKDPGNHTPPSFVLAHPGPSIAHYLAANGGGLAAYTTDAPVFGALVVALDAIVLCSVLAAWWRRRERPPLGAWLIVAVAISCAMITLNRAGFGVIQALESRYTALTVLAPVGIYWWTVSRRDSSRVARALVLPVATLLAIGYLLVSVQAWTIAPEFYSRKSWKAYLMYTAKQQPLSLLDKLYANPYHARAYSEAIERLGYNVFAEKHLDPASLSLTAPQPSFIAESINGEAVDPKRPIEVKADDPVEITGWAFNDRSTGPARDLFLTIDGTRDLPAHVGMYRPGLGGGVRQRGRRWAGFTGSFGGFVLDPGEHTVALKIVADDGRRAYLTEPVARIIRR
jgi:hypothetical protein